MRRALLMGIAERLITPGTPRADVMTWLRQQHELEFDDVIFFRFAQRFEETCRTLWMEHATNLLNFEDQL